MLINLSFHHLIQGMYMRGVGRSTDSNDVTINFSLLTSVTSSSLCLGASIRLHKIGKSAQDSIQVEIYQGIKDNG